MSYRTLSSIAEVVMGQSPTKEHVSQSKIGLPLLNGPTEFGYTHPSPVQWTDDPRKKSQSGDLLFCVRGSTTGRMNWSDQEYAIGRGLAAIRGKNGYRTSFVRAHIEVQLPALLALSSGSTFPNVSRSDIESIKISDLTVDQALSPSLLIEAIDEKIANNRALATDLEAIARAIFKTWFVNFDPVKAKMEGRPPTGMDADTAALFPDKLVESELGLIPKGWKASSIGDIATNVKSNAKPTDIKAEESYVALEHFERGCLALYSHGRGKEATSNKTKFTRGDLLFGKLRPYFHKVSIAPFDGVCSTDVLVIRPITTEWTSFVYCSYSTEPVIEFVTNLSSGTRMPRTNWKQLSSYPCAIPPAELANVFNKLCTPMFNLISDVGIENSSLAMLRDHILPRLISGRLRLPEAEPMFQEAI